MMRDMLEFRISNEKFYNECMITIRNPEVRKLFTQMRDDEMRSIIELQQKIIRHESTPKIIAKLFTTKGRY